MVLLKEPSIGGSFGVQLSGRDTILYFLIPSPRSWSRAGLIGNSGIILILESRFHENEDYRDLRIIRLFINSTKIKCYSETN